MITDQASSGKIYQRLASLTPILQKVASGDFSQRIMIPPEEDELTDLLVALNLMIENLNELTQNLEKRISEKTNQLATSLDELEQRNQRLIETKKNMGIMMQKVMALEAKNEALLKSISDGVLAVDTDKKIIALNFQTEKLFGVKSEKIIGKPYTDVCRLSDNSGKLLSQDSCPFAKVISSGKEFSTKEYFYVRDEGNRIPIALSVAPVVNSHIIGAIAVIRDISLEKQIERAKDEFISLVSHQLRTPLTSLSWYSDLLLEDRSGQLSSSQKQYMDEIQSATQRMNETVNLILNISRVELGAFQVNPTQVNVCKVVEAALNESKKMIELKKIHINSSCGSHDLIMNIDAKILEIVLQNLLSNAIKYTAINGEVNLFFEINKLNELLIKITDNGCGIPRVDQPKIFTKVFRATNANLVDPNGNGLGLYLTKSVLDRMGGKIWFESEENKGSTFYVTIPLGR